MDIVACHVRPERNDVIGPVRDDDLAVGDRSLRSYPGDELRRQFVVTETGLRCSAATLTWPGADDRAGHRAGRPGIEAIWDYSLTTTRGGTVRSPTIGHSSTRRALATLTATLIFLTGCSSAGDSGEFLKGIASVRSELVAAGFDDAGVHAGRREYFEHPEESVDIVTIVLLHDSMDADAARKTAATVVWNELPMRFDILTIEYQGEVRDVEYDWLADELGPRPAGLDDKSVGDYVAGVGSALTIVGAIAFVVLLIVAAPIVVLIRRNLRKKARLSAPGHNRLQDEDPGAGHGPGPDCERTAEPS